MRGDEPLAEVACTVQGPVMSLLPAIDSMDASAPDFEDVVAAAIGSSVDRETRSAYVLLHDRLPDWNGSAACRVADSDEALPQSSSDTEPHAEAAGRCAG